MLDLQSIPCRCWPPLVNKENPLLPRVAVYRNSLRKKRQFSKTNLSKLITSFFCNPTMFSKEQLYLPLVSGTSMCSVSKWNIGKMSIPHCFDPLLGVKPKHPQIDLLSQAQESVRTMREASSLRVLMASLSSLVMLQVCDFFL